MKHINFLGKQEVRRSRKIEFNYLWLLVLFGVLVSFSMAYTYIQKNRLDSIQAEIGAASQQIETLKAAKAAASGQAATSIPSFIENAISWSDLIRDLSSRIPSAIKLNEINSSLEKKQLTIIGVADSAISASQFEQNLAGFKWCEKMNLASLRRDANSPLQFSFQVECTLR